MTTTAAEAAVALGATLLDNEYGPEWPYSIDLDTLSTESVDRCVLGQLDWTGSRSYLVHAQNLFGADFGLAVRVHGFETPVDGSTSYSELDAAWGDAIRARR